MQTNFLRFWVKIILSGGDGCTPELIYKVYEVFSSIYSLIKFLLHMKFILQIKIIFRLKYYFPV